MQFYTDESRACESHTLPNAETFELRIPDGSERDRETFHPDDFPDDDGASLCVGWYWRACFPGCLPDGDPVGPFSTEALAITNAQDSA